MNIRFSILGPVRVFDGPLQLGVGGPKQRAVLAALLLERGRFVSRDALVDAVWDDAPPASAAGSIQVYVHGLRQALGADRIETRGTSYRIVAEADELDAARFETLLAHAQHALTAGDAATAAAEAEVALAQWSGPALTDLDAGPALRSAAAALDERRMQAVVLRNEAALAEGRHHAIVAELGELVAAHPYRERLREQLILALYRCGRQEEALAAYRDARRTLIDEVGIEPGPRLRELEAAILRQEPGLSPAGPGAPPEPAPSPPARTLPVPPTRLIGRDPQLEEIVTLFEADGARLVTLTGPGGVGKTRLAIAAAERLSDAPVWVDLAPVSDHGLVPQAVAETLGVPEHPDGPAAAAIAHLAERRALVVLDNFEQVLDAAAFVAELLSRAPELCVMATSRAPLRIRAEHELAVPPLPGDDAVRLFASRARAADRAFVLDDELEPWVARICRRLDGLPLAIELAATRLRALGPAQLDAALERRLELLVDGPVDLPARQRALRATLDWSHEALTEPERRSFAWLGVLAGAGSPAVVAALGARDSLDALLRASLVVRDADEHFGMLETVREYALERLEARGEASAAHLAHARHFLAVAERAHEAALAGSEGDAVYPALERDHDNLRAALLWASAAGEVEIEVGLVCALRQFWLVRGHVAEGRRFFEQAVADAADAAPALRARALMHGGPFAHRQGALDQARAWMEEALELSREVGDDEGVARCAGELGAVAFTAGDLDRALAASTESAEGFARLGDDMRLAIVHANLAEIESARGNDEEAIRQGERALALQRSLDDREQLAVTLHSLGRVRLKAGDETEARELLLESLTLARELDYREMVAMVLVDTAELAFGDGEPEVAARLLARGRWMRDEIGVFFTDIEDGIARLHERLVAALGADAVARLDAEAADASLTALSGAAEAVLRSPAPPRPRAPAGPPRR